MTVYLSKPYCLVAKMQFLGLFAFVTLLVAAFAKGGANMDKYMKRTGKKFLDETSKNEGCVVLEGFKGINMIVFLCNIVGVISLKSGMLVEVLKSGSNDNAKSPNVGDACEVTYSGTLKDGSKFDAGTTSFAPNQVCIVVYLLWQL